MHPFKHLKFFFFSFFKAMGVFVTELDVTNINLDNVKNDNNITRSTRGYKFPHLS